MERERERLQTTGGLSSVITLARTCDCGPAVFMSWRFCCRIWGQKSRSVNCFCFTWQYTEGNMDTGETEQAKSKEALPYFGSRSPLGDWWTEAQTGLGSLSWWLCCQLVSPLLSSTTKAKKTNNTTSSNSVFTCCSHLVIIVGFFFFHFFSFFWGILNHFWNSWNIYTQSVTQCVFCHQRADSALSPS